MHDVVRITSAKNVFMTQTNSAALNCFFFWVPSKSFALRRFGKFDCIIQPRRTYVNFDSLTRDHVSFASSLDLRLLPIDHCSAPSARTLLPFSSSCRYPPPPRFSNGKATATPRMSCHSRKARSRPAGQLKCWSSCLLLPSTPGAFLVLSAVWACYSTSCSPEQTRGQLASGTSSSSLYQYRL